MGKTIWSTKVVQFSWVYGVVVIGGKIVEGKKVWGLIFVIIFVMINGVVGLPFDN